MNPRLKIQQQQHQQQSFNQLECVKPNLQCAEHEMKFDLALSKNKQYWASGYFGTQVLVGNLENEVLGFKATRILKKAKSQIPAAQVGAKLLVNKGQVDVSQFGDSDVGRVEKLQFGDGVLAVAGAGNLFLYGW